MERVIQDFELEFGCSICQEIFLEAAVANCGHSFCRLCITKWGHNKRECPLCKNRLVSLAPNYSIQNYIKKFYGSSSKEYLQQRESVEKERKILEKQEAIAYSYKHKLDYLAKYVPVHHEILSGYHPLRGAGNQQPNQIGNVNNSRGRGRGVRGRSVIHD